MYPDPWARMSVALALWIWNPASEFFIIPYSEGGEWKKDKKKRETEKHCCS